MSPSNAACPPLFFQIFYLVSVCLCVAIIAAFQLTAFTFRENLAATALLLALFGYVMRNTTAELWFVFWEGKPSGWLWTCCLLHDFFSSQAIMLLLPGLLSKQAWTRWWMPCRGGEGWRSHNEDGIGPASERPSSCLTNLCSGKWILCYSHFDINRGLKYIIQLAQKLHLWRLSCEAIWNIFPLL